MSSTYLHSGKLLAMLVSCDIKFTYKCIIWKETTDVQNDILHCKPSSEYLI